MMESAALNMWSLFVETIRARWIAIVCAAAVAIMAIGVFHAPSWPVILGCGGAVTILITRDCLFGRR
ncbi:MAG TPA: hypothetical protein VMW54_01760 [Terriglobia bacterium]|nr:hypothetical protein [Terriglobia bacterium]